jgi:hypothetical protein
MLFVLATLPLAILGVYFLFDFFLWQLTGIVTQATITGFQERKSKGMNLPVLSYKVEGGGQQSAPAQRIDRFLFLFNRPDVGEETAVIYRKAMPGEARVYGYIHAMGGAALILPFLLASAVSLGRSVAAAQISYIIVFLAIIVGGWIFLKIIQRS